MKYIQFALLSNNLVGYVSNNESVYLLYNDNLLEKSLNASSADLNKTSVQNRDQSSKSRYYECTDIFNEREILCTTCPPCVDTVEKTWKIPPQNPLPLNTNNTHSSREKDNESYVEDMGAPLLKTVVEIALVAGFTTAFMTVLYCVLYVYNAVCSLLGRSEDGFAAETARIQNNQRNMQESLLPNEDTPEEQHKKMVLINSLKQIIKDQNKEQIYIEGRIDELTFLLLLNNLNTQDFDELKHMNQEHNPLPILRIQQKYMFALALEGLYANDELAQTVVVNNEVSLIGQEDAIARIE